MEKATAICGSTGFKQRSKPAAGAWIYHCDHLIKNINLYFTIPLISLLRFYSLSGESFAQSIYIHSNTPPVINRYIILHHFTFSCQPHALTDYYAAGPQPASCKWNSPLLADEWSMSATIHGYSFAINQTGQTRLYKKSLSHWHTKETQPTFLRFLNYYTQRFSWC